MWFKPVYDNDCPQQPSGNLSQVSFSVLLCFFECQTPPGLHTYACRYLITSCMCHTNVPQTSASKFWSSTHFQSVQVSDTLCCTCTSQHFIVETQRLIQSFHSQIRSSWTAAFRTWHFTKNTIIFQNLQAPHVCLPATRNLNTDIHIQTFCSA